MIRREQSVAWLLAMIGVSMASGVSMADEPVDFRNDVMAVLTKNGCNAGACHGAAIGRGGFKLSLYGGNPDADFEAIVRQVNGRRVNLAAPAKSLIVLKPAEHIEHGGGTVFDIDSPSAKMLLRWIRKGATERANGIDNDRRQLQRVDVSPSQMVVERLDQSFRLRATAHYVDGTKRDVTQWTIFTPEDKSAVTIRDNSKGLTEAVIRRRGRHIVVARYLSEVVPLEIILPMSDTAVDLSAEIRRNFIDEEVLQSLASLGISPSPDTTDAGFLRRATLDLTGRLPTPQQVNEFLDEKKANKRAELIDRLLASDEFVEYWTFQLAKLLRIRPQPQDGRGADAYHNWLSEQIRDDRSYRAIVTQLLMATGDTHEHGPANFYRTVGGPREQAEFVSELLMGSRLRCANCHNHPLDRWTQDDYHGLAAIFAKIDAGRVVRRKPNGEVIHPRTLEAALPRIPGERFIDQEVDGRAEFNAWLTSDDNPYFAKAIVNRLWKRMMGRGLVEPTDDFRATNPPTHPALLERLAVDFAKHGHSLRHTLRTIATSAAYARSANATKQNKDDDRYYSHALRRPLEPEVLADAISDVLGVSEKYGDQPNDVRAVSLVDPSTPSRTLDVLGRCDRQQSCETASAAAGGLPQKLHLFNGDLLNARIGAQGGRLHPQLGDGSTANLVIREFYVAALSRRPTAAEAKHWEQQLEKADDVRHFLEDFVWGLMTCQEFVTNH